MTAPHDHEPVRAERTRTSSAMVATTIAVICLILLIVFIAQNNRQVPVHFLWLDGTSSESIALVVAAVAGAALVLAIGIARIVQLRLAGRRHNRAMRQQDQEAQSAAAAPSAPVTAGPATAGSATGRSATAASATAAPQREA